MSYPKDPLTNGSILLWLCAASHQVALSVALQQKDHQRNSGMFFVCVCVQSAHTSIHASPHWPEIA